MPFAALVLALVATLAPTPTPRPTPTPSPSPTAEPLRVSTRVANNDAAPVHIFKASLRNASNFRFEQCVSFRNVSTRVATDVDLSFVVKNRRGETEADFGFLDKGTFTPPIAIDNHCWYRPLWEKHVVRRMTDEIVRVKSVAFTDGSTWYPGTHFMRAFGNDGQRLPAPVAGGAGAGSEGMPPARSTTPLPANSKNGAIYYEPRTFASGSAVDRPTPEMARDDAQAACNVQTAGRNDCRLGIEFSTPRCAALGVLSGDVEYGTGANERDARAMVLGKIPGAKIITVDCNSA